MRKNQRTRKASGPPSGAAGRAPPPPDPPPQRPRCQPPRGCPRPGLEERRDNGASSPRRITSQRAAGFVFPLPPSPQPPGLQQPPDPPLPPPLKRRRAPKGVDSAMLHRNPLQPQTNSSSSGGGGGSSSNSNSNISSSSFSQC
ncbi:PREDICTED: neural Wiskott-Aldrich syndrome protein-like [Colobus angolensis palliatus]|uniref:neural Wiskott-Aldrich syndrome protein-like n=1 Tax=Colobus angolensis palliatus TaxID=336983 RepID=UPI0005F45897|nr:PREDICTED: neural Wiskott-Aldrich syndrome protein-like [Colobus angolensis palliatus]